MVQDFECDIPFSNLGFGLSAVLKKEKEKSYVVFLMV